MATAITEYQGVTKVLVIRNLTLRGVPVTSAGQLDRLTYRLVDRAGTELGSGDLVHDDDRPGTWTAETNVPDRPGEVVHVRREATKGMSNKKWHGTIRVKRFN
jgi:hypothetical protein